jgi:hypothetical protein
MKAINQSGNLDLDDMIILKLVLEKRDLKLCSRLTALIFAPMVGCCKQGFTKVIIFLSR